MSHTEYDARTDWDETGDEIPLTVITGNFGEMYHYEIKGYLTKEPDTYSRFDVFVDGERINQNEHGIEILADEADALLRFIEWVAKEVQMQKQL